MSTTSAAVTQLFNSTSNPINHLSVKTTIWGIKYLSDEERKRVRFPNISIPAKNYCQALIDCYLQSDNEDELTKLNNLFPNFSKSEVSKALQISRLKAIIQYEIFINPYILVAIDDFMSLDDKGVYPIADRIFDLLQYIISKQLNSRDHFELVAVVLEHVSKGTVVPSFPVTKPIISLDVIILVLQSFIRLRGDIEIKQWPLIIYLLEMLELHLKFPHEDNTATLEHVFSKFISEMQSSGFIGEISTAILHSKQLWSMFDSVILKSPNRSNYLSQFFNLCCSEGYRRGVSEILKLAETLNFTLGLTISREMLVTGLTIALQGGHLEVVKLICPRWEISINDIKRILLENIDFTSDEIISYLLNNDLQYKPRDDDDYYPSVGERITFTQGEIELVITRGYPFKIILVIWQNDPAMFNNILKKYGFGYHWEDDLLSCCALLYKYHESFSLSSKLYQNYSRILSEILPVGDKAKYDNETRLRTAIYYYPCVVVQYAISVMQDKFKISSIDKRLLLNDFVSSISFRDLVKAVGIPLALLTMFHLDKLLKIIEPHYPTEFNELRDYLIYTLPIINQEVANNTQPSVGKWGEWGWRTLFQLTDIYLREKNIKPADLADQTTPYDDIKFTLGDPNQLSSSRKSKPPTLEASDETAFTKGVQSQQSSPRATTIASTKVSAETAPSVTDSHQLSSPPPSARFSPEESPAALLWRLSLIGSRAQIVEKEHESNRRGANVNDSASSEPESESGAADSETEFGVMPDDEQDDEQEGGFSPPKNGNYIELQVRNSQNKR